MKRMRESVGLIAALLLTLLGGFLTGSSLLGKILFVVGLILAVWQGLVLWRRFRDPYNLDQLWDSPFPEDIQPDEDHHFDPEMAYCHRCGHAVPEPYARCPDCGTAVR